MISENLQDLNYEYIILNEPIKNSAVQYNYFYKLLYSTHIVSLTSIFLLFELNTLSFENDKIKFDKTTLNNSVFSKLIELEDHILNLIVDSKYKLYKLKEIYENEKIEITEKFICEKLKDVAGQYFFFLNGSLSSFRNRCHQFWYQR